MSTPGWTEVGDAEFVSLGTFRRNGERVDTPVWVAREGEALVVVTAGSTGKAKRLRRDPRAELRVCSRRGHVEPDAATVLARGEVAGAMTEEPAALAALKAKYGVQLTMVLGLEKGLGLLRRRPAGSERVILRLLPRED